ncbi:Response regulator PleD [Thalassocella blandensis]|nr:Response regulator PleD [Thalassocella blandensis]
MEPSGDADKLIHLCHQEDTSCPIFDKYAQLQREMTRLEEQVRQDHLTGLYNHRFMKFILEQEMERTIRTQLPTCFILLDIDHFKTFNDQYGHVMGDKVLIHIASILQRNVRKIDFACRYGGEEFAVILPTTPLLIGIQVAERIRQTIEHHPLEIEGESLAITASLGVDSFTHLSPLQNADLNDSVAMDSFIARADEFLYKAKSSGRNRVEHAILRSEDKASVSDAEKAALYQNAQSEQESP